MAYENKIAAKVQGKGEAKARRVQLVAHLEGAFESGGSEAVKKQLKEKTKELRDQCDTKLKELRKML